MLIYYKAIADLVWCVFTAIPAVALSNDDHCFCTTKSGHFVTFMTEFSLAASILCIFMLSVDLFLNSRSPFVNFKKNLRCYTVWIPIVSLVLGIALVASGDIGLYLLGFCLTPYLEDRVTNPHVLFAAMPVPVCGIAQVFSVYYAYQKLKVKGRQSKLNHRNEIWGRRNRSVSITMCTFVNIFLREQLLAVRRTQLCPSSHRTRDLQTTPSRTS